MAPGGGVIKPVRMGAVEHRDYFLAGKPAPVLKFGFVQRELVGQCLRMAADHQRIGKGPGLTGMIEHAADRQVGLLEVSRRTAFSIVSPGSINPARQEYMPGPKCAPRARRHLSPCTTIMIATGSVRGKCCASQLGQVRRYPPSRITVSEPHRPQNL